MENIRVGYFIEIPPQPFFTTIQIAILTSRKEQKSLRWRFQPHVLALFYKRTLMS